eukprot:TRINITY_DN9274_c3_g1_i1.p1 TRINITY_DN9274_c3_g1~~TRINITY_DN9274_c3_g1_i1.p1  ORF type:complete len:258 (+),score=62.31 TRINITY_DN9274_c3_g1_i1:107-775(+)
MVAGNRSPSPAANTGTADEGASEARQLSVKNIMAMLQERQLARRQRNFEKADSIRDELKAKGITIDDRSMIWTNTLTGEGGTYGYGEDGRETHAPDPAPPPGARRDTGYGYGPPVRGRRSRSRSRTGDRRASSMSFSAPYPGYGGPISSDPEQQREQVQKYRDWMMSMMASGYGALPPSGGGARSPGRERRGRSRSRSRSRSRRRRRRTSTPSRDRRRRRRS